MAIFRVDNQSELNAAILRVRGGDSILLSAGRYEKLELNSSMSAMKHVKFASSVTIASADESRPAVIGSMNVNGAANLKMSGLKFDHTGRTDNPFRVNDSSGISITDSVFDGHTRDGFGSGMGLMVSRSSGVVVENNTSFNFGNGYMFSNVQNLVFENNDISRMSNDGARFAGVTNAQILDNDFHDQDSPASRKHKDAIQFWTSEREGPSKNVVIRGNEFSNTEVAQTIYMGNELARSDATKGYRDFFIEDNVIRGGHAHGITIEHVNGAIIRDNLVERAPGVADRQLYTPIITVGDKSVNVVITGNGVASISRPANATWKVFGNELDGRKYLHWTGDAASGNFDRSQSDLFRSWLQTSNAQLASQSQRTASASEGETFWFEGWGEGRASKNVTLDGVDFDDGDALVFSSFDKGSFQAKSGGNFLAPRSDGTAVRIDSLIDLAELAHHSADVRAWTDRDGDLVLRVAQDHGVETYTFKDLGEDYLSVDQPYLF